MHNVVSQGGKRRSPWPTMAAVAVVASILAPLAAAAQSASPQPASPQPASQGAAFYELRTYHANPGKFEALNARFRDHTLALFKRAGMTSVAYWSQQDAGDGVLVYILAYPSKEAREAAWARFRADPEWRAVSAASEADGKLVSKVDSVFMTMTDYSPHPVLPNGVALK